MISLCEQGDAETLKKYCAEEVIEHCTSERAALRSHGFFYDNKVRFLINPLVNGLHFNGCGHGDVQILHISEVEILETKMMGHTPVIIVRVNDLPFFFL